MKTSTLNRLLSVAVLGAGAFPAIAAAEDALPNRPPMRVAPTHEELVLQLRKAEEEAAKRPPSQAPLSQDPSTLERPQSLMSRSHILCYGGAMALVPKRSVLQYPKGYADRLVAVQGAKVLSFPDFLAANRSWITTYEVSRAQAQGKDLLPEEAKAQMVKTGNLIVATYSGNPIEVMPPATPEEAPAGAQLQSQTSQP